MHRSLGRQFAALIALVALALPAAAEPLDALIERTLAAYGGQALPEEGTVLETGGAIWSNRLGREGEVRRAVAWPGYLSVEIAYPGVAPETRLMIGDKGWRDGAPAPAPLVNAMRLQAARLSLPMLLDWERGRLHDLGPATRGDGLAVRRLRLDLDEGLHLFVEIDPESGRILRSAGVMRMGGAEMSFGAAYEGFSAFGALTWPAREEQSAMGRDIGWTRIERLSTAPLDAQRLKP